MPVAVVASSLMIVATARLQRYGTAHAAGMSSYVAHLHDQLDGLRTLLVFMIFSIRANCLTNTILLATTVLRCSPGTYSA